MTAQNRIVIEIQYFSGCPHSDEMIQRVRTACNKFEDSIDYQERLVETSEKAQRIKFRGSPTVIINGFDLENMPEPASGSLACRYYPNGLPQINTIETMIRNYLKK
jgi:hypothetical protein